MPPAFVIPRGLSTLYRCLLTTVAQDKPYHEKPLIRDCFNHKGSCTQYIPYLTIADGISSSSFVRVSTRQLAVSSLSKGISSTLSTLNFFSTRALVLTGLELANSRTQSERRIDWANLTYSAHIRFDGPAISTADIYTVQVEASRNYICALYWADLVTKFRLFFFLFFVFFCFVLFVWLFLFVFCLYVCFLLLSIKLSLYHHYHRHFVRFTDENIKYHLLMVDEWEKCCNAPTAMNQWNAWMDKMCGNWPRGINAKSYDRKHFSILALRKRLAHK